MSRSILLLVSLVCGVAPAADLADLMLEYREAVKKVGGTPEARAKKANEKVGPILEKIGALKSDAALAFLAGELDRASISDIAALCVAPMLRNPNSRAVSLVLNGFSSRAPLVQAAILTHLAKTKHDLEKHEPALIGIAGSRLASNVKRHVPAVVGRLGSAAAAKALLKKVGDGKRKDEDESAYNSGVYDALKANRNEEIKKWLATDALSDAGSNHERNIIALRLIGDLKIEEARKGVEGRLRHTSRRVADAALGALLKLGVKGSVKALTRALEGSAGAGSISFRTEALDALARTRRDEAVQVVIKCAASGDSETRNIAMGSLAFARHPAALPALIGGLTDDDANVRNVALRSLRRYRSKAMVGELIRALGKQKDESFKVRIADLLVELTGKNVGLVASDWQKWWDFAEETFEFPTEGSAKKAVTMVKVSYFGIGVDSKKLALLLDASSSMRQSVPVKSSTNQTTARKIEVLKKELKRLLEELPEDTQINMIRFDKEVHPWKKKLQSLKGNGRRKAIKYVDDRLKTATGTNVFDTIEFALKDTDVDTIYLLTDGEPSQGRFTKAEDIIREVDKLNRMRAVTIHCIAFGAQSEFLKKLARANGGKYRFVEAY